MACLSGKTKERFRKADPFQTPGKLEASTLGAINGFFVLPMVVLVYAIFLAFEFNPLQSNSTIEVTVKCTPLKFTCTSKYGCEIAPMGTLTTENFSKVEGIKILKNGETANLKICPGQHEALDIAPRASLRIPGAVVPRSLAYNNLGYFVRQPGVLYKVNLTSMSVIREKKIVDGTLIDAFQVAKQVDKHGYFVTSGFNLTVYKVDLETMEIVGTGNIVEKVPIVTRAVETPAHGHYAYFLLPASRIVKFNLETMKVEKERSFPNIEFGFDWGVISGYMDYYSSPPREISHLYAKEILSSKMYVFDTETLEFMNVTDLGEKHITSVCKTNGNVFGEIRFGTAYGKTKVIDPKTLNVGIPPQLKYDQDLNFPITALLCNDDGHNDGVAGVSPKHSSSMTLSYGYESHGEKVNLDGAKQLVAPINSKEAVYFLSMDSTRESHVLKLDKHDRPPKGFAPGIHSKFMVLLKIPNDAEPLGFLQDSTSMKFPAKGSKRSIFSLFTTTTTFVDENNGTSFKYAFWPEYARNFDEEDCKTYQPNFLCRRVNLAPTELKILMSYKYNMYIIATLCLTASSTIYNGLKMLTRHGPKIYDFIKNKCCGREARESNLSSRLLQAETTNYTDMDLLPNAVEIRNRNGE